LVRFLSQETQPTLATIWLQPHWDAILSMGAFFSGAPFSTPTSLAINRFFWLPAGYSQTCISTAFSFRVEYSGRATLYVFVCSIPTNSTLRRVQMQKKRVLSGSMMGIALLFGSLVYAQMKPVENINAKRHPNLAAAQRLCDQAFQKIQAAQAANEWDLGGHAAKAKELLDQASRELKEAALAANKEHK
jgi:hypothetical protein